MLGQLATCISATIILLVHFMIFHLASTWTLCHVLQHDWIASNHHTLSYLKCFELPNNVHKNVMYSELYSFFNLVRSYRQITRFCKYYFCHSHTSRTCNITKPLFDFHYLKILFFSKFIFNHRFF